MQKRSDLKEPVVSPRLPYAICERCSIHEQIQLFARILLRLEQQNSAVSEVEVDEVLRLCHAHQY